MIYARTSSPKFHLNCATMTLRLDAVIIMCGHLGLPYKMLRSPPLYITTIGLPKAAIIMLA